MDPSHPLPPERERTTALLRLASEGDRDALDDLFELLYAELRRLAQAEIGDRRPPTMLQATALVHEVYARLVGSPSEPRPPTHWDSRRHFVGTAARAMRCVIVDYRRRARAAKRGGNAAKMTLESAEELPEAARQEGTLDLLAVDEALAHIEREDEELARIAEQRYFCGLTIEETAEIMGISVRRVKLACAVLRERLSRGEER